MRPPLSLAPLLPVALSLALGVVMGRYLSPLVAIAPILLSGISIFLNRRLTAVMFLSVGVGMIAMIAARPYTPTCDESEREYSGVVENCSEGESSRSIIVEIDHPRKFVCLVTTPSFMPVIARGDIIGMRSLMKPADVSTDLPDEFNLEEYYFSHGITTTMFVKPGDLTVTTEDKGIIYRLSRLRDRISEMILASDLEESTARFICATLLGERSLLDDETVAAFNSAGIAHVLAISGMHVGILTMILSIGLYPLAFAGIKRGYISAVVVLCLWIYAIMTGLFPPTVRAVIMATMVLGAYSLQRSHSSVNALCFAAIIILILQPRSLFGVGFQLSFTAVAAILAYCHLTNNIFSRNRLLKWLMNLIGVPVAATIATSFITAYYFHKLPLLFIISNIPIVIILPMLMLCGIALLLCISIMGSQPQWIVDLANLLYNSINGIACKVASLPGASIDGIYLSGWVAVTAVATIACAVCWRIFRRPVWGCCVGILIMFNIVFSVITQRRFPENEYYITRNSHRTDIIIKLNNDFALYTTAATPDIDEALSQCRFRYRDYAGWRKLPQLRLMTPTRRLVLGPDTWIIVNEATDTFMHCRADYMLVCREFKGDIVKTARQLKGDTVVLSNDIHPRRRKRYFKELTEQHISVIDLTGKTFHKTF